MNPWNIVGWLLVITGSIMLGLFVLGIIAGIVVGIRKGKDE